MVSKSILKIQDKILSCILKIKDTVLKIVCCTTLTQKLFLTCLYILISHYSVYFNNGLLAMVKNSRTNTNQN